MCFDFCLDEIKTLHDDEKVTERKRSLSTNNKVMDDAEKLNESAEEGSVMDREEKSVDEHSLIFEFLNCQVFSFLTA